jgi:hypothetical protein
VLTGEMFKKAAETGEPVQMSACAPEPEAGSGIHTGRIRVTGRAPDGLTWTIGRKPVLVVRGREKELV